MKTVTSKDGTTLAFDESGKGRMVIFVDGALQYRAFDQGMAQLADLLAPHFTVIHYDRRGRGDSTVMQGDAFEPALALQREIEDIEALIDAAFPVLQRRRCFSLRPVSFRGQRQCCGRTNIRRPGLGGS